MTAQQDRAPSIYTVASLAGVSPSTVSRVFARPGQVSAATAARVREVAAEVGYRTRLRTSPGRPRSHVLALVLTDIRNPGYLEIIRGCEDAASEAGSMLLVANARESGHSERAVMERGLSQVDGMVVASSRMTDSAITQIAKQAPLVMLNRVVTDLPSVVHDNAEGMALALDHLADLGHRRICYLGGPESSWANSVRWQALRTGARKRSLPITRLGPFDPTFEGGLEAAAAWQERPSTAVVAFNDLVAVGFIHGMKAAGVAVPAEVSVVGFDNSNVARIVSPQLTTVASPMHLLGEVAVRNLLSIIVGAQSWTGHPLMLPTRLVTRQSTAATRPEC